MDLLLRKQEYERSSPPLLSVPYLRPLRANACRAFRTRRSSRTRLNSFSAPFPLEAIVTRIVQNRMLTLENIEGWLYPKHTCCGFSVNASSPYAASGAGRKSSSLTTHRCNAATWQIWSADIATRQCVRWSSWRTLSMSPCQRYSSMRSEVRNCGNRT